MPYLDPFIGNLTKDQASHLLRRATFGPTNSEIDTFTGKSAVEAYDNLMSGNNISPSVPIVVDENSPFYRQPIIDSNGLYIVDNVSNHIAAVKFWWTAQMFRQDTPPSILEKLTLFWQNHFVTTGGTHADYRYPYRYLLMLRNNALGSFRSFVKNVTLDPSMLVYLNGNENVKGTPNENYARELQELFVVGVKDFYGNNTYTETDVKQAAKVLTGWKTQPNWPPSVHIDPYFDEDEHDTGDKFFSNYYGTNVNIVGQSGPNAGNNELDQLIEVLLGHPETAKFICRKLYRWYVNPIVSNDIELNVIIPLANFFKSPGNNWAIEPVIKKLLTSQVFFQTENIGAIIKSPLELAVSAAKLFNLYVPDDQTDTKAFDNYFKYVANNLQSMQMDIMEQPSVFGYEPYYLNTFSKTWISSGSIVQRNQYTNQHLIGAHEIKPGYVFGPDVVEWIKGIQPNLTTPSNSNPILSDNITTVQVLEALSKNFFVNDLFQNQKDFLIDSIMMAGFSRTNWLFEWQAFRLVANNPSDPTYGEKYNTVFLRLRNLLMRLMRMAEFHIF